MCIAGKTTLKTAELLTYHKINEDHKLKILHHKTGYAEDQQRKAD